MHRYLGMKLDYRKRSKVKIEMSLYLKHILYYLPSKYQGETITPAGNHPLEVNETARKLSKGDAHSFRTIVAKLLFLCKQS